MLKKTTKTPKKISKEKARIKISKRSTKLNKKNNAITCREKEVKKNSSAITIFTSVIISIVRYDKIQKHEK